MAYRMWRHGTDWITSGNEFHSSLNTNFDFHDLGLDEYNKYIAELIRRRNIMHELDFMKPEERDTCVRTEIRMINAML